MEKKIRVGKIEDQDRFRREDMLRMTPNERLQMLLDWRDSCFPDAGPMPKIAKCGVVPWMSRHS